MTRKQRSKKWFYILGGLVVLLIAWAVINGRRDRAVAVSTEDIRLRSITESVAASGKIAPEVEVSITSLVSGEILELPYKEGDAVQKGDLLVRINPDLIQAGLERARAALNNARANEATARARILQAKAQFDNAERIFNRNKELYLQKVISLAEYENLEANYESSKAELEAARQSALAAEYSVLSAKATVDEALDSFNRTIIYATMDGTISLLNKRVGEQVVGTAQMAGTEIMRVANLTVMQVEVDVNESDIVKVHLGDTTVIEVDAYFKRKFKGSVTEIANSASNLTASIGDQATNFKVKIRILESSYADLVTPGSPAPFRPGMNANVEIKTATKNNVLSVPIGAVTTRTDTSSVTSVASRYVRSSDSESEPMECVFLYREGKAVVQVIQTGIQDNKFIEVTGLSESDVVITGPYDVVSSKLRSGDLVKKSTPGESTR